MLLLLGLQLLFFTSRISAQTCPFLNKEELHEEIRSVLIDEEANKNASPLAIRLAWHSSGTFDKESLTGGSNGATMRFELEANDGANAGLNIMRDMLLPITDLRPDLSFADTWIAAGAAAVEFTGGPSIPYSLGRTDATDGSSCPPNGRLPDASKGSDHLRQVFYRMGFADRDIVALSGAHTLGRCHTDRSGFDGPWTESPLVFNNEYFKNLIDLEWQPRQWDGPLQYEDVKTKSLMMLPTDIALKTDPEFSVFVKLYASDEQAFFLDFKESYSKLLALGTDPGRCSGGA